MTSGYDLHRPYADSLRDGIHELRVRFTRVNYRMLYFFHGNSAVVLTHGFTKEKQVPEPEIEKAMESKRRFQSDPRSHTFQWEP
jgi:phage-related protein